MSMGFPLRPIVLFDGDYANGFLTEHNRGELSVSYDEIGNTERTASGALRGYVVTRKRSWSLNWSMVPADSAGTVDGYWSAHELNNFYNNTFGTFIVKFYRRANTLSISNPIETVECRFNDFSYDVIKRGIRLPNGNYTDFCDFSCSWEEV